MLNILARIRRFVSDVLYGFVDESKIISDSMGKDMEAIVGRKCNIRMTGTENIPKSGPFIVSSNHLRNKVGLIRPVYDLYIISIIVEKVINQRIRWLMKPSIAFDLPGVGRKVPMPLRDFFLDVTEKKYGSILIDPELGEQTKFKVAEDCIAALENDDVVGIMPEGDLYDTMSKAKKGLYFISKGYNENHPDSPVKILPVAIWGFEKSRFARKRDVQIHFLPPITIGKDEDPQEAVDRIMITIARKLPEKYRGYYEMAVDKQEPVSSK